MIEVERTFLAKHLPDLSGCEKKEILDIYLPKDFPGAHAPIRIRKNGNKFEITKKTRPDPNDHLRLIEQTIVLTQKEFDALEKEVEGKRVHKIRYYYKHNGLVAEIDVFQDDLLGLVVVEFEVPDEKGLEGFTMPDFCLADVSHEGFIRGGMLCGKNYADIEKELMRYNYKKILLK